MNSELFSGGNFAFLLPSWECHWEYSLRKHKTSKYNLFPKEINIILGPKIKLKNKFSVIIILRKILEDNVTFSCQITKEETALLN